MANNQAPNIVHAMATAHANICAIDYRYRAYNCVVSPETHKDIYWASRYTNIHRLITHCSNRPKVFRFNGIDIIESEEV